MNVEHKSSPTTQATGNVYHIIFDGFQSQAYERIIEQDQQYALKDFTFYPHFTSNYLLTKYSVGSLMFGKTFDQTEDINLKSSELFNQGLPYLLHKNSVDVSLYSIWNNTPKYALKRFLFEKEQARMNWVFVDLTFRQAIPFSLYQLLNQTVDTGPDMGAPNSDLYRFSISQAMGWQKESVKIGGAYSHENFERMLEEEDGRKANG